MSPDLKLLVWSAALALVQAVIAVTGAMLQVGLPALAGNREGLPEITRWAGRALRAHRNMLENLLLFTALIAAAHFANKADASVVLGAQLFFWARLVYAGVYIAGLPWIRTGVWAVSVVGLIIIFLQLI